MPIINQPQLSNKSNLVPVCPLRIEGKGRVVLSVSNETIVCGLFVSEGYSNEEKHIKSQNVYTINFYSVNNKLERSINVEKGYTLFVVSSNCERKIEWISTVKCDIDDYNNDTIKLCSMNNKHTVSLRCCSCELYEINDSREISRIVLIEYSFSGCVNNIAHIECSSIIELKSMFMDIFDNIYLVGNYSGNMYINDRIVEKEQAVGICGYVVKINPSFHVVWCNVIATSPSFSAQIDIHCANINCNQMLALTGISKTSPIIVRTKDSNIELNIDTIQNQFIITFNTDGKNIFAKQTDLVNAFNTSSLSMNDDSIFVSIINDQTMNINKYDLVGNIVSFVTIKGVNNDNILSDIFHDKLVVGGECSQTMIEFGSVTGTRSRLGSSKSSRIFLALYNSDLELISVVKQSTDKYCHLGSISIGRNITVTTVSHDLDLYSSSGEKTVSINSLTDASITSTYIRVASTYTLNDPITDCHEELIELGNHGDAMSAIETSTPKIIVGHNYCVKKIYIGGYGAWVRLLWSKNRWNVLSSQGMIC